MNKRLLPCRSVVSHDIISVMFMTTKRKPITVDYVFMTFNQQPIKPERSLLHAAQIGHSRQYDEMCGRIPTSGDPELRPGVVRFPLDVALIEANEAVTWIPVVLSSVTCAVQQKFQ